MAKLGISTGTTPNDGTGDSLLVGAIKVNSNFSEIYNKFGDGTNLTAIGGTWAATTVGINTLKNVGIGTTNPTSKLTVSGSGLFTGVVTATNFIGNLTGNVTGISSSALMSTYSVTSGVSTYATTAGISTYSSTSGIATYASIAGLSTYSVTSGVSTSVIGGIGSISQLLVGVTTSLRLIVASGGISVAGIVTVGSSPIVIDGTSGNTKINIGSGTTIGEFESTIGGILRATYVAVGNTNPSEAVEVIGNIKVGVNTSNGLILTSPNGTKYRLIVANDGSLSTVAV